MVWDFVLWRIKRWRRASLFIDYDIIENPDRLKGTWADWTPAAVAAFRHLLRCCSQKAEDTSAVWRCFLFGFNICLFISCYWGRVWRHYARFLFFVNFWQLLIYAFVLSNWGWRRIQRRLLRVTENILCQFNLNLVQRWVALFKEYSLFWACIKRVCFRFGYHIGLGRFWYLNRLDFLLD